MKSMFRVSLGFTSCSVALMTVLFAMLFPAAAKAVTNCPPQPAGKVNIIWSSDAVKYDFSKSQAQMDRMETDTENPYDRKVKTHVGGLMSGGISLKSQIQVATMTYPQSRVTCQWIDSVDVTIAIDPTIYIAAEHPKGSCKHNAILDHEMKHVFVDREVVKRYAPAIKKHLEQAVIKVGIVGPKPQQRATEFQKKITDYMDGQLKTVTNRMYEERRNRQQQVDTLEEYERVSNLCR